ncbi:MAG: PDZ domain-containing protein [bacterium]
MPDLTSGLTTANGLEDGLTPYLRITSIAWDSPFRNTGLSVGDRIVAVNGQSLTCAADPTERARMLSKAIGQTNESQGWSAAGLAAGATISLTARRRAASTGWSEIVVRAPLTEATSYRDANNRIVFGTGGPDTMAYDDFPTSWGNWYNDRMLSALGRALDPEQHTGTFVTRFEWKQLGEHADRVAYAVARYPGAWSRALQADYESACNVCAGSKIVLAPGALDFRRRGEELAAEVRAKAIAAWDAAKAERSAHTITSFPAINPVRDDVRAVVGKLVVLPPLANNQWVSEAGHGWFAAGSPSDGWYFLDAEAEPARAMLYARQRFGRMVDPNIAAQFEFIARITDESRLVVINERAHFGLLAEPIAALVGGAMFVDLAARKGTEIPFAGETVLVDTNLKLPPANAPPAAILGTMIDAVKLGDLALWRALHADWSIERNDEGRRVIYPHCNPPDDSNFEESRRSMNARVLDVRVSWIDDAVVIADGARFPGALHIEETAAQLEHYGDFDGETRSFADVTVRRNWRLQRVDGGPWRIAAAQPI